MYLQGTPYILICEAFWDTTVLPPDIPQVPKAEVCPAWDNTKKQLDRRGASEDTCFFHQAFLFIHEGVHFYIQTSLGSDTCRRRCMGGRSSFLDKHRISVETQRITNGTRQVSLFP